MTKAQLTGEPPRFAIQQAVLASTYSPCAKSKRGVCVYVAWDGDGNALPHRECELVVSCSNSPPHPFECARTEQCRANCAKVAVHAEEAAAFACLSHLPRGVARFQLAMVHAKTIERDTVGGVLAAGGGPSCVACSKMLVNAGFGGIWLYEVTGRDPGEWRFYSAPAFHLATLKELGLPIAPARMSDEP